MSNQATLTNTSVKIIGATTALTTTYGQASIGATGATYDISSTGTGGGTVTIGSIGDGNVTLGNTTTGTTTVRSLVTNISTTGATTVNIGNTGTTVTAGSFVNIGTGATGINIGNSSGITTINSSTLNINNKFKVVAATSGGSTVSLLMGDSIDSSRAISSLNSTMTAGSNMAITYGKDASTGNQSEMLFTWNANSGNNFTQLGHHSMTNIAYGSKGYVLIGAPASSFSVTNAMNAVLVSGLGSQVVISGSNNTGRTDGPAIISQADGNNLINFLNSAATALKGAVTSSNSSGVVFATSSDRRLKTNITPMTSMIDKIKQLNPAHFVWKEDGIMDDGFIAQEVYKVFPHFIGSLQEYCDVCKISRNDIYKGKFCSCCNWEEPLYKDGRVFRHTLDYGKFTPYLTKALQESIELIENQQKEIETLQSQVQTILQKLNM